MNSVSLTRMPFAGLLLLMLAPFATRGAEAFELRHGDRVAFIGDVLMEREQVHGRIETALTLRYPGRNVIFRNLGWSGDRPDGIAREGLSLLQAGKEPKDEGFKQLTQQIELARPTVVVLGYGMASSFEGEEGLAKFSLDMERLVATTRQVMSNTTVRFVILSPIRHENLGDPWPDPASHNATLKQYAKALEGLAKKHDALYIDLFDDLISERKARHPLTQNGIHLTDEGYQKVAELIERGLGWKRARYTRQEAERIETLRQAIIAKNVLFFDRSRPQNMAYIFGFRKHEQGRNAVEIPQFDPLIEQSEARISQLRKLISVPLVMGRGPAEAEPPAAFERTTLESMNFTVADGLEVNLYAQDPLLAKPINMNFDAEGRLWVASSSVYPQIQPGQVADDRVLVLEDTDRDGVAEKSTTFADGLLIPTTVIPGDGGVYVGQSTELLFFKDTDGDGKSDEKRIVLSGFGTEDTHHTIHTLRWGLDGNLYVNQSVYIRSHLETPTGVLRLKAGGIFHLRTDNLKGGIAMHGLWNSWGHQFDQFGQSFATDGAGFNGMFHVFPGVQFNPTPGTRRIMDGVSPGSYPKFCGLELVASQHFPDDWQNDFVTCDFRAHRIVHFKITEDGAGYVTQEQPDLLRTANVTFRPIDVKFGPDGALYVADWSNPIIQHGEVDFRDPRRDKTHGRIWRITAKGRPLAPWPKLVKAQNEALFEELRSPNVYNRLQASRVLTERGDRVVPDLKKWTEKQSDEAALLASLWLHQSLDVVDPVLLVRLLHAKDGRIRAAAARVLYYWADRVEYAPIAAEDLVKDDFPRVRLEALRVLSRFPSAKSASLALSILNKPMDRFLDYGLWLTINDLAQPWVDAIKSGDWKLAGHENQLEFGLKAIDPELASTVLGDLLKRNPLARDGSGPWIELISQAGGPEDLRFLFDQVLKGGFDAAASRRAIEALANAMRLRQAKPSGDLTGVRKLMTGQGNDVQAAALRLIGAWKQRNFVGDLLKLAGNVSTPAPVRDAAFDSLRDMGGKQVAEGLGQIAAECADDTIHRTAALTMAALDLNPALPHVLNALQRARDDATVMDIWRTVLNVRGAGEKLAAAVPGAALSESAARTGLRAAREGGRNERELVVALSRAAGLLTSTENMTPAQMKALAEKAASSGNAVQGEMIYRRQEYGCITCHSIGGVGGKVGPDLTSIGASAPVDYLVESLVKPNDKIKEGFHSVIVQTKDELEYSGIVVREDDRELVIRNAANQEVSVAKGNISNRKNGLSLMPAGLIDNLTDDERAHLVRFLSELGKPGRFDASKGNVARSWKLLAGTHRIEQFGVDKIVAGEAAKDDWKPVLSLVDGSLPKGAVEEVTTVGRNIGLVSVFASADFQVSKAGTIRFTVPEGTRPGVWIDGKSIKHTGDIAASLSAGAHTIILRFDAKALPEYVKLESPDATFVAN